MNVSILGGSGLLGSHVATELDRRDIDFVSASRSALGPNTVRCDITTGEGLEDAISDCDTVILLSSNPRKPKQVDIEGTGRLLPLIGGRHLVFISIVGVDRHPLPYYKAKFEAERMITGSGVRHSILRATQFHDLMAFILAKLGKPPICLVPRGFVFQPVATGEVARELVAIAGGAPAGRVPDFAGPEILPAADLARSYMTAIGRERPVLKIPIPGKIAGAFKAGVNTNSERAVGTETWEEYLLQYKGI